jgi:hypothetical protein
MYRLDSIVVLKNKEYERMMVIDRLPEEEELKKLVELRHVEKLTPFQDMASCVYGIKHPTEQHRWLKKAEVVVFFSYLKEHGWKVESAKWFKERICTISK